MSKTSVETFALLSSETLKGFVRDPGDMDRDRLIQALAIATAREVAQSVAVGRVKPEIDPDVITLGSDDETEVKKEPGS